MQVGRLLKRYRTGDPSTFLLTNSIRGIGQLVALADLVLQVWGVRVLREGAERCVGGGWRGLGSCGAGRPGATHKYGVRRYEYV